MIAPLADPYGKFASAVHVLSTHGGFLKSRLRSAAGSLGEVEGQDFDGYPELKAQFAEILSLLHAVNTSHPAASIEVIIDGMNWRHRKELADRVFALFVEISEVYHAQTTARD